MRKISLLVAVAASISLTAMGQALAQADNWPDRPVRFVVPYPAGGNADVVGRIVAQGLQEQLKQPFVIENKPGAGGVIGASSVVSATPDGYTFLFSANGPILFSPELVPQRPYEWQKDFTPVSTISLTPLVVIVAPSFPAKTFNEFLEIARKEDGKLTYASAGLGTINHLFSEHLQSKLNVKWTTLHYKGTAPAMNDLIAAHVPFGIDQVSVAAPYINDGRVRALAVTGERRSFLMPDVPTLKELGYPDLVAYTFTALMAPAGTPAPVISKLHRSLETLLATPAMQEKIRGLGADVSTMQPDAFTKFLAQEAATWIPIVRNIRSGTN